MPIEPNVISGATDNISDWSNDTKARLLAEKEALESMQNMIGENLRTNALSLQDADRIAEQVTILRDEVSNPTG